MLTQNQLNEWEALNIIRAENWLYTNNQPTSFLTLDFIKLVHKRMFNDTWKWAGTFRKSEKNIGIELHKITTELKKLLDDVEYQIINRTYFNDEIAYRFHHRLVYIHLFPNGNGRHARTLTDYLLFKMGTPKFTWGEKNLILKSTARYQYIEALQKADSHDYNALAVFVRS